MRLREVGERLGDALDGWWDEVMSTAAAIGLIGD